MTFRTTAYSVWIALCAVPGIFPQLAKWQWASLAMVTGAALAYVACRSEARGSSLRAVTAAYTPRWPTSIFDAVALFAFMISIVPTVYAAMHGDAQSVFRAIIFGNLCLVWLRYKSGRQIGLAEGLSQVQA